MHTPVLTAATIRRYLRHLQEQERAAATLQKYDHDLNALREWLGKRPLTKQTLLLWKEELVSQRAPATVNTILAALNGYLSFMGWVQLRLRPLRLQRALFQDERQELSRQEYVRLVAAAQRRGNQRLFLVIQAICATGIRVSELRFLTAEAVAAGRAEISNKGKRRIVFLPDKLRCLLQRYLRQQGITHGPIFLSRTGKPLDRSHIWREMKALCQSAEVSPNKVFPHNLRHLFARTYYTMEKDLSRLADILGHSSVNTTRIYTAESGIVHARQVGRLGLVVT